MSKKTIGIFIGSLRKESFSKKIALSVAKMLEGQFETRLVELGGLAMFNQDFDDSGNTPPAWTAFRNEVKALDAFLFVTPEYNRCVPAVLKNALDIGSRPYGHSVWDGKPGGVISVSIGKLGGFGANHDLRQAVVFLNIFMLQQPEAYIGGVANILDAAGNITDAGTRDFLQSYADAFAAWINKIADR
ncbi:MAG: NAD(P)H-dependent oxidoreductase [Christensenellaceae bacterium]|jgi:chromate reductase|nr:NAD(P)H-dependent oxidoreductase [Christensenellaceae bacterium]